MAAKIQYLRRYTNLPSLFDILQNKRITLLDPMYWDDRNDSFFIEQYKEKLKYRSVRALCFTTCGETYHHWKVFSPSSSGICIQFRKDNLLTRVSGVSNINYREVQYHSLRKLKRVKSFSPSDLPFIKRLSYKDEKEYRIIFSTRRRILSPKHIDISLDDIERIILSPWTPEALIEPMKHSIRQIDPSSSVDVWRSNVINSHEWQKVGRSII